MMIRALVFALLLVGTCTVSNGEELDSDTPILSGGQGEEVTGSTESSFTKLPDPSSVSPSDPTKKESEEIEGKKELDEDQLQTVAEQTTAQSQLKTDTQFIQNIFKKIETIASEAIMPSVEAEDNSTPPPKNATVDSEGMDRMSQQIRAVIKHYQEHGAVTLPGADIPDPFPVPDVKKKIGGSPMTFSNMTLYGLSNFTVDHVNTDLDKMQVYISVYMNRLVILGNYSIRSWLSRGAGPFNVTLLRVHASGAAALTRDSNGNLMASDSEMDMDFLDARVDFKNLGMMGTILQGVLASAAPVLFDAIKPSILSEINSKARTDINAKIKMIGDKVAASGSVSPVDLAVAEGRRYVKENGYDPYHIKNYTIRQNIFEVNVTNFVIHGLSQFYRVGDVELSMDNGTIQMGVHVATRALKGSFDWSVKAGNSFLRRGVSNLTVAHIQIQSYVNQSLDISRHPQLDDLDINVGKVSLDMNGLGTFDLVVEALVNTLPDLIRHIIVDATEEPIKYKVQEILNRVNVEKVLEKSLPELDNMGL